MFFFSDGSLCRARMTDVLKVKKLSEHAVLPVRGSEFAAGYDLASAHDTGEDDIVVLVVDFDFDFFFFTSELLFSDSCSWKRYCQD